MGEGPADHDQDDAVDGPGAGGAQVAELLADLAFELEGRDRRPDGLRDLLRLWDEAPGSRRGLAESLFKRVEVLGLRRMHLEPTPAAVAAGLVEALLSASAGYGRGERDSAATSDLPMRMRLAESPEPFDCFRST